MLEDFSLKHTATNFYFCSSCLEGSFRCSFGFFHRCSLKFPYYCFLTTKLFLETCQYSIEDATPTSSLQTEGVKPAEQSSEERGHEGGAARV